jgi:hypothetical protein
VSPNVAYADEWKGWGDWLGTGNVRNVDWRPFADAREFARSLGFKGGLEWRTWCKTPGNRPLDIPSNPNRTYADEWKGWGDFLGGRDGWRSFAEAREYAHSLGFKSMREWQAFAKSDKRPADVPATPNGAYARTGWTGWGNFLGTKNRRNAKQRPFDEARKYARSLGLKSQKEWRDFRKSERRQIDIPSHPDKAYASAGWAGYGDWLGTGRQRGSVAEAHWPRSLWR